MARYENKKMKRIYDPESGLDHFQTERLAAFYDLSGLRFLWRGIDTIRQLYRCTLRSGVYEAIVTHWENASSDVIEIGGIEWKLSSSGKKSSYRFILKNLDVGMVVLLKSYYCEADKEGSHIKIECTPQLIDELGLSLLTKKLREVASVFGDTVVAAGVSVHLALDMKGLELPEDFEDRLICRTKRSLKVNGISDGSFGGVSEASFVYGRGETYMFGKSTAVQMCLYNKSIESVKSGKLAFHEMQWRGTPSVDDCFEPEYKDGSDGNEPDTVHRLEFRIHHSVIKEFENGHFNETQIIDNNGNVIKPGEIVSIREPRDLKRHLQGLWLYCLNIYRLQHSTSYVHPIWQKIGEDIKFSDLPDGWMYTRSVAKRTGLVGKRNIAMWMGNYLRIAAALNFTVSHCVDYFLASGIEFEISHYFGLRLFGESNELHFVLTEFVTNRLRDHRLNGVALERRHKDKLFEACA